MRTTGAVPHQSLALAPLCFDPGGSCCPIPALDDRDRGGMIVQERLDRLSLSFLKELQRLLDIVSPFELCTLYSDALRFLSNLAYLIISG